MSQAAKKQADQLYQQGRYSEALDICLKIIHDTPDQAYAWKDAAVYCVLLSRWQEAVDYASHALEYYPSDITVHDALASANSELGRWDEARRYGAQALQLRDQRFGGAPVIALPQPLPALPPPPSAQTRGRNIIAFSLFGIDSKYCEPAVLNAQDQPHVYPDWVCRFYVDGSVPEPVLARLQASGAQLVRVQGAAAQWPGPMWRFLALDDPQADRVLFRDADAVISPREAGAVGQWLTSGKRFHVMRDWGSHTELMQAGMWGVVAGSLPPLGQLMERFLREPLQSVHFADQYFLRQYVWPYARTDLMQHDSVFGFMDAVDFPDGPRPAGVHVGGAEGGSFSAQTNLPPGAKVVWALFVVDRRPDGSPLEKQVCAYPATVQNGGLVQARIPDRYSRGIKSGTTVIRLGHAPMTRVVQPPGAATGPG